MQFPPPLAAFEENFYKGTWGSGLLLPGLLSPCQCRSGTSDTAPCQIPELIPELQPLDKEQQRQQEEQQLHFTFGTPMPELSLDAQQELSRGWALMEADSSGISHTHSQPVHCTLQCALMFIK